MEQTEPLKRQIADYYSEKINTFGVTSRGVDWNSTESQWLRFEQLLEGFPLDSERIILNDYGCGYGELLRFLDTKGFRGDYRGYDFSEEMITAAQETSKSGTEGNKNFIKATFILGDSLERADYTVASGIFNVRQNIRDDEWEQHIRECLSKMNAASHKGFAFNMLTSYSDPPLQKDYLYYASPMTWFDYCKRNFSRNVALLHDYDLYEFTVRVRLENSKQI